MISLEFWGYIIGSIAGLLLIAGLLFLVVRWRAGMAGTSLLERYIRHVMGPPLRVSRFLLYGLVAILIAGLVNSLSDPAQAHALAQSAIPWVIVVYAIMALIGFVRWLRSH
jgi:hypothetical protein